MSFDRVLQLCPLPTGWRVVRAFLGCELEQLEDAADESLFEEVPIAALALTERREDQTVTQFVQDVLAEDWPEYLAITAHEHENAGRVGYLAPGQHASKHYREEAIEQIRKYRERQARG